MNAPEKLPVLGHEVRINDVPSLIGGEGEVKEAFAGVLLLLLLIFLAMMMLNNWAKEENSRNFREERRRNLE